jgi:hypothetical protein
MEMLKRKGLEPVTTEQGLEMMKEIDAHAYVETSSLSDMPSVRKAMDTAISVHMQKEQKKEMKKKQGGCLLM